MFVQFKEEYGHDSGYCRAAYNKVMEVIDGLKSGKMECAEIVPDVACRSLMPPAAAVLPPSNDSDDSDHDDGNDGNDGSDGDGDGNDSDGHDGDATQQARDTQYSIESFDGASPTLVRMYVRARMYVCM